MITRGRICKPNLTPSTIVACAAAVTENIAKCKRTSLPLKATVKFRTAATEGLILSIEPVVVYLVLPNAMRRIAATTNVINDLESAGSVFQE
jgi:hypothetical protein